MKTDMIHFTRVYSGMQSLGDVEIITAPNGQEVPGTIVHVEYVMTDGVQPSHTTLTLKLDSPIEVKMDSPAYSMGTKEKS